MYIQKGGESHAIFEDVFIRFSCHKNIHIIIKFKNDRQQYFLSNFMQYLKKNLIGNNWNKNYKEHC